MLRVFMCIVPESEVQANFVADTGEKRAKVLAKFSADVCPLISRRTACKKFHKNPPHIPRGMKQNSFTAGPWELGRHKGCDPSIPPEEFLGPSGPKLETELKMSSRGLPAPGPKKLKTESKKKSKMLKKSRNFHIFDSFSTLFLTFWAFRPRELIFNSVSNFGPEGPKNSSWGD